jgi:hypothetical protein
MIRRPISRGIALLGLTAAGLLAQTSGSGTITGTVTDVMSAVVPGATVVVHNADTGVDRKLETNDAGIYVATFLQPGAYEITVSKPGFQNVTRKGLTLEVGRTLTIDFPLTVQASAETVNVTSESPVVDPEKTEVSQVVSETAVQNLPINGRRWDAFALMTPNVTTDGGTGLISYRGISGLYNNNSVDGANNQQAFFSESKGRTLTGVPYVYSLDSIQEFQVSVASYSAEFGQAAGGQVNAVTKSGSNTLHGDLFYYLRYPSLNALDPIQKSTGNYTQPVHQQQQFGGSVGGPIIKDKLFYFFTYDGSRKVNPISYVSSSSFPQPCVAAISAAQCAAANKFATSILGAYPRFANQDVGFGKLDYHLNDRNHLNASYNMDNFKAPNSYTSAPTFSNSSLSMNGTNNVHERIFVASWDSTINSSTINNFRFQWSRDLEVTSANGTGPSVSVANVLGYGMPNALPRPAFPDEHRLQFTDVMSLTRGRHTIKTGFDVNAIHELLINLFQGGGVYNYTGSNSFSNWASDVMSINLGDGLTGRHYNSFVQVTDPVTGVGRDDFYNTDIDGFVEDTWKVRPNVTLNLGLRYDVFLIPAPPKPNTSTPLTTLYTSTINVPKDQLAPRFGIAWSLGPNTVVRAGYGIFYAKTSNSTYYATRVENGEFQQTYNCTVATCPQLTFPNLIFTPPGGAPAAPFAGAVTPLVVPFTPGANTATTRGQTPDWVNPRVHEGEASIERRLPGNISVSAGYVVGRGLHLPIFIDTNLATSSSTRSYDVTNTSGATQSTFTVPFYSTGNGINGRIDPTGPILTGFSDVNSWYNSFVLTFRKQMSRGVEFTANYTLAKAVDGGQVAGANGTFNGTDYSVDPHNRKAEYALSDLDQRQRFVANAIYIPQFTRNIANRPARLILDGFNFSTIVTIGTGFPVTPMLNMSSVAGAPDGGPTGAVVNNSGTGIGGRSPFLVRNGFTGPGLATVDFRIGREFKLLEKVRFSVLGEAFNLFNFTNFFTVNTTAYNYSAAGSGVCAGHANGCLVANPTFLAPLTSNNNLYGARQLQVSAKLFF